MSEYKFVQDPSTEILQRKCDLEEIPGLILAYEEDPISNEPQTCRMPCGHIIGRDCMTKYLKSLI